MKKVVKRKIKVLGLFARVCSVRIMSGAALAGVLLAASLVAPVALPADDVSALGESGVGFAASFGSEWPSPQSGLAGVAGAGVSASSQSGGSAESSEVLSSAPFLVCPVGFERFGVGLGSSGWGCRRLLGEAVAVFSCVEGVLSSSGGSRVCVWVVEVVEVEAAVGSCSPGGVPPSCRYVDAGGVSRFGELVFGCRSGWTLSDGSCSQTRRVERSAPPAVVYSCSSGVLVTSHCYEYAEPLRACSPGWVLRVSGLCERVLTAAQQAPTTAAGVWGPPGVPSQVRVSLGVRSGVLTWEPPSSDGGSPVTGYVLRWREGTRGTWTLVSLEASTRRYEFSDLVGGGYYQIKLSAQNRAPSGGGFQEGRWVPKSLQPCSAGQRVIPALGYVYCSPAPPPLPPAPGALSLTAGIASLTASWGTPVLSEGDAAVEGFVVQWRRERGALDAGSAWNSVPLQGAGVSSYTISGLLGGVSYQVRVKAYSAAGKRGPSVLGDGIPLLADECLTGVEPGYRRQVLDLATGVCVSEPETFTVEVGDGDGELQLRGGWPADPSPEPVSDYVVRWREPSGSWSEPVAVSGGGVLYQDSEIRLDYGRIRVSDPSYSFGRAVSVEAVHTIEGLANHRGYDVEVRARNAAGSSRVMSGSGSPCPDPLAYVASESVCAEAPVPEGVEVVSGDRSLTVRWRQDASLLPANYTVFLYPPDLYRIQLYLFSWSDGVEEVVGGRSVRTWSHTFTHEFRSSLNVLSRLTNGRSYRVGIWGSNGWFSIGEEVFVAASPCADCERVSRPAPPAAPPVCSGDSVPVAARFCLSPCPPGQLRPENRLYCVTPAAPTLRTEGSSVAGFGVSRGGRHGTLDVSWRRASFSSRDLPVTRYVVKWRRLGGALTESSVSVPPIHPDAEYWGFRLRGLAVGARYLVGVAAVNDAGTSRFVYETIKADCGRGYTHVEGRGLCLLPPRPPGALVASASSAGAVKVSWEQASWNNYSRVTGYLLRWRPAGGSGEWTSVEVPWTAGTAATISGAPRRNFTYTITDLTGATAAAGARIEIQVASDNQIPDNQSRWISTRVATCPASQVHLSAATGCVALPALPTDAAREAPTLTLHPTTGAVTAAWWQRSAVFNPDMYKLEWTKTGAAAFTSSAELTPAEVNIPLPSGYTGWTLNARHIPSLDMCTHDVRVTAAKSAQKRVSNTAQDAPMGTVTAPDAPRDALLHDRSATGDQFYVYWQRPECDGGAPLSEYKVTYKLSSDTTWTDATTITSTTELARTHNGYLISGLTQGTKYDVRVTAKNNQNLTNEIPWVDIDPKQATNPSPVSGDHVWRPYRMPSDQFARISERIQMGLTIRICTSASDFIEPLNRAVKAWNAALADNQLNDPDKKATARSEDAPAGAFEFSGNTSAAADCGEEKGSGKMLSDNQGFEAVIMDYRTNCPATSNTCADTSCVLADPLSETANNCASTTALCSNVGSLACVQAVNRGDLLPRKTGIVQVAHMIRRLTDRVFAHELGHYLLLVDYRRGCHYLGSQSDEASLMSYGPDLSELQRRVNTQNTQGTNCRSNTITKRDKEDLHAIYHPPAFGKLSSGAGQSNMEHFTVESPPQDLEGNDYYNAYRYVILHRAPKGSSADPNAFTQLTYDATPLNHNDADDPVVFTPKQVKDAVDSTSKLLTSVNLVNSAFAKLRGDGHEFVFVGVTRGDPQRDPSKPLNPAEAADPAHAVIDLAHAVMLLDLGLEASTGLDGEHNWTLGEPVLYTHP